MRKTKLKNLIHVIETDFGIYDDFEDAQQLRVSRSKTRFPKPDLDFLTEVLQADKLTK